MEYMHELKEKLCEELEEIARKPEMSAGDLEAAHKLTDTIKNIDKIDAGRGRWVQPGRELGGRYARYLCPRLQLPWPEAGFHGTL